MYKPLILTALAALAMLGMQACFYTGSSGPYTSSLPSVTTHTVCDTNGNNCLACDDNNSCERTDAHYRDLLASSGLSVETIVATASPFSLIEARRII